MLVGRNGSGKSNFLDALQFVADCLETTVDHAIRSRGGIDCVRRRSTGHPHNLSMRFRVNLADFRVADYSFEIGALKNGGFQIKGERLAVLGPTGDVADTFAVESGPSGLPTLTTSLEIKPPALQPDRLQLVALSGFAPFRPVYDALSSIRIHSLNPERMRENQVPDAGDRMHRDGGNLASVLGRLETSRPKVKSRLKDTLRVVVREIEDFERASVGPRETIRFKQAVKGSKHPWNFYANSMSDGTLRALGILTATMPAAEGEFGGPVGIEEPETALHPAAMAALVENLRDASHERQILVTTHSPDLLDQYEPDEDTLLAVVSEQGLTRVAELDDASRRAIRDRLYSTGELLRLDQLEPSERQRSLFDVEAVPVL
jgi:predicted ATPase